MSSEFSVQRRLYLFLMGVLFCLASGFTIVLAEESIDTAPIIISEANSTRALTIAARRGLDSNSRVFNPGEKTRITVFVTGINLLPSEGATAFRADATDGRHSHFPLQIISLVPTAERPWAYALTFKLSAGMGDVGDVLLRVTWRGMTSNRVRVAIGHLGDGLPDDVGAVPTPMPKSPLIFEKPNSAGLAFARGLPYAGDRVRFMHQATFGANPTLENQLRRLGLSTWISLQMETKLDADNAIRYSMFPMPNLALQPDFIPTTCVGNCIRDNYTMYPLQNWFFREALYGEDQQLRRRVSWGLHQIFVVSGRRTIQPSRMVPYIRILDKNAFGNFRILLKEITLNPAMGNMLDMAVSTRQNPNENYARELLELFTIGHSMLNRDGTPVIDAQGNAVPSYTQDTVDNFTKVFTGWRFCGTPANCPGSVIGTRNFTDQMELVPANHDQTEKRLLEYPGAISVLPAGQNAEDDLGAALDNIFYHPNTAPFVSRLLILQLVTGNPTPAYVGRVADVFSDVRGAGVDRGNLGKVIRAILLDPEARGNIKTDPDYGHLKEPVIFVTNFLRALEPTANNKAAAGCKGLSDGVINGVTLTLDQDVFIPPGVFSYYSPIYSLPNTNLIAPEFNILTTGTALKRLNAVNQFVPPANIPATPGITVDKTQNIPCGTRVTLTRYQSLSEADPTGTLLVDTLNRELLNGSMSFTVKTQILNAVRAVTADDSSRRTRTALYLLLTSSQYQVQR
jgi:uncharacterized protein (DUF1800 family)